MKRNLNDPRLNDHSKRTVRFSLPVIDGMISLNDIEVRDGATATIILKAVDLLDKPDYKALTQEHLELFLPAHTRLFAVMHHPSYFNTRFLEVHDMPPKPLPPPEMQSFIIKSSLGNQSFFVEFELLEDQKIYVRGGDKRATLDFCKCGIPALDRVADSINHAYTLISEVFEPHRKGHGGNVFLKVVYEREGRLELIDNLRKEMELHKT